MSEIKVIGKDADGKDVTFEFGKPVPPGYTADFDLAMQDKIAVGVPWFLRVPSHTDPEGFVAAALWLLDDVTEIQGFEVPKPDPDLNYL